MWGAAIRNTSMKMLWCWRCRRDVPMLDEDEFAVVSDVYRQSTKAAKEFRKDTGASLEEMKLQNFFEPVCETYEQLTGERLDDADHILKHCIAKYGPPCANCGRVLRTPEASKCFECGQPAG